MYEHHICAKGTRIDPRRGRYEVLDNWNIVDRIFEFLSFGSVPMLQNRRFHEFVFSSCRDVQDRFDEEIEITRSIAAPRTNPSLFFRGLFVIE
jgi:hypothetical protein